MSSGLVGNVKLGTSNGLEWVFTDGVSVRGDANWELGPDEVIKLTSDDDDIIVYGTMVVNTTQSTRL